MNTIVHINRAGWRMLIPSILLTLCLTHFVQAQVLDYENKRTITLSDGTAVTLFGQATKEQGGKTGKYYYLPTNLRLATREDGTPQFLFLKYTTEERADQGGVNGALVHFLMEWGLTPEQEQELKNRLEDENEGAKLMGAVDMMPEGETGSFEIVSATLSDQGMTPAMVQSGKAPIMPGAAAAVAARLDKNAAQLLSASFEESRSITDVSIALNFAYQTLTPAARGRVVFDWSRYEEISDTIESEYAKWQSSTQKTKVLGITVFSKPEYSYSYDEMRSHYDFLEEKSVIRLEFDELVADERVATIREAFFQYFLNTFTEPEDPNEAPAQRTSNNQLEMPDTQRGNQYTFKQTFTSRSFKKKQQVFDLNYRMAIRRPHQLVGNLATWYDHVRDNPRCVNTVNLNDPFFQHRDINFILDLDAKEMFDEAINYVTVNVRKKRSQGHDFSDRVTINKKFLEEQGITATMTYARGEDRNPDLYEYQAQWSLRGGKVFPEEPAWTKGTWEGVTLGPPVKPRTIEFEADLEELKTKGITRITAQIHYRQFGEEIEENIHLSPARGEPITSRKIFIDQDQRGYAYRLVFNHKEEGKLALDWEPNVSDDYIYATVPENLDVDDKRSPFLQAAKEAGREIANSTKLKVLDRFNKLLGD